MKVNNINGTSQNPCRCGSWLDHWENFSGQPVPTYCPGFCCYRRDLLGVHVKKAESDDDNWYIVPLCAEHNRATGTLTVTDGCRLVSANVRKTCGK
jgi:hypothetical protein